MRRGRHVTFSRLRAPAGSKALHFTPRTSYGRKGTNAMGVVDGNSDGTRAVSAVNSRPEDKNAGPGVYSKPDTSGPQERRSEFLRERGLPDDPEFYGDSEDAEPEESASSEHD